MILANGILRPGKVLKVGLNGEIKAFAPGLFSQTDPIDSLPPIYPFFGIGGQHANTYSMPKKDDDIWVLNLTDNKRQLYWFRRDNFKEYDKDLVKGEEVEVLCNRSIEGGYALLYFNDGTGWIINNKGAYIQINANGDIDIIGNKLLLGSIDTNKTVARAEDTIEILKDIWVSLQNLSVNLNIGSIVSGVAGTMLLTDISSIPGKIDKIKSDKIYTR